MTLGVLLAVAAAAAGRAEPVDGTLVAGLLQDYNKQCWANHCNLELASCMEYEHSCREHFTCVPHQLLDERSLEHCFGETRWKDLSNRELDVFACAADNACVSEHHPALSFLEEEIQRRPQSLAQVEDGSLEFNAEEEKTVTAVFQLRAALQRAKNELTRTHMMNALAELSDTKKRLAKLDGISKPTTEDVILGAALERRMRHHDDVLKAALRETLARATERPLDLPYIAKLPRGVAIAPYTTELSHVLDKLKHASTIRTRRKHREHAKSFVKSGLEAEQFLKQALKQYGQQIGKQDPGLAEVTVGPDGNFRH
jgi:hypothetical protein